MKVLGIYDGKAGGAALIEDGKIICAVNEERLIRAKLAIGFPRNAINHVLEISHTKPEEIDAVAIAGINEFFRDPARAYEGWLLRNQTPLKEVMLSISSTLSPLLGSLPFFKHGYYNLKSFLAKGRRRKIVSILRQEWGFDCPMEFVDHHFAHACSAYYTSGLKDATVITMDGAGDHSSSHVYSVKDGDFKQLCNIESFDSIGNYYAYVTHLCGFKAARHEGKITGLAAHGKPIYADILKRFIVYKDGKTINKGRVFYWSAIKKLKKALPETFKREDLARSIQQVLEEEVCSYVSYWVDKTRCRDIALAGGVFGNVRLNQKVHELGNVNSIFIHPAMGDDGLAVGAAFAVYAGICSTQNIKVNSFKLEDVYFGPCFNNLDIKKEIEKQKLHAEYVEDIEKRIAKLLAEGYVVARFDGSMEYGPRALGTRSILYQTTDATVNDWLNKRLRRTEFMPFAPVTLEEFADQCYENMDGGIYPSKFMTIAFNCTDWMRENCPAVVHVDSTARPQLIDKQTNPSYYRILDEYRNITGLSSLINTSFNMHEEPIVCSPYDAIRAFKDGHLDYLAIGNYLLKNSNIEKHQ